MRNLIHLDRAATTPLRPEARRLVSADHRSRPA